MADYLKTVIMKILFRGELKTLIMNYSSEDELKLNNYDDELAHNGYNY